MEVLSGPLDREPKMPVVVDGIDFGLRLRLQTLRNELREPTQLRHRESAHARLSKPRSYRPAACRGDRRRIHAWVADGAGLAPHPYPQVTCQYWRPRYPPRSADGRCGRLPYGGYWRRSNRSG